MGRPGPWGPQPGGADMPPEEQFAREAAAAGLSAAEIEARTAAFHLQEAADRAEPPQNNT